jgi:hypothetical protein
MDDRHVRSARVLDPAYLSALPERSVDELRAMHAECLELETEVSYVRRLAQARIDILEAERGRRARGGSVEDLINALPQILADTGPRANAAASRLPLKMAPDEESEWADQLDETEGLLANLPSLSDADLVEAVERLRVLEHDVSAERRALFAVIDRIDLDLAERLKAEEAG